MRTLGLTPKQLGYVLIVVDVLLAIAATWIFGLVGLGGFLVFGILFLRRRSLVRGSGWQTCPNCGEHASQDVVDELAFVSTWWIRLGVVGRLRSLACRRCGYRRPAGRHALSGWVLHYGEEMRSLDTAGQPIHRAWLIPMGLIGLVAFSSIAYFAIFATPGNSIGGITFASHPTDADKSNPQFRAIARDLSFDVPSSSGTYAVYPGTTPPEINWSDTSGQNLSETIIRDDTVSGLQDLVVSHFQDQRGLSDVGFPATPPAGQCTTVGGQKAYSLTIKFTQSGQESVILMWAVMHDGVGYVISFAGSGSDGVTTIQQIARHVIGSIHFSGTETPGPTPTPSPSVTPGGASPTPSPAASPSPGSSASPSPAPIHC